MSYLRKWYKRMPQPAAMTSSKPQMSEPKITAAKQQDTTINNWLNI